MGKTKNHRGPSQGSQPAFELGKENTVMRKTRKAKQEEGTRRGKRERGRGKRRTRRRRKRRRRKGRRRMLPLVVQKPQDYSQLL